VRSGDPDPQWLVRGAAVVDGTGDDPAVGDVRIDASGLIAEIGPSLHPVEGERTVDGDGLVLAPGFIDLHSHSDLYTLVRPDTGVPIGDAPKLLQGCTAQVFGQDGVSAAPVNPGDRRSYARDIAGLDGTIDPSRWTWRAFADYLAAVRGSAATRAAGLVGHSTVRRYVMGVDDRPPTDDELAAMQGVLAESLDGGAAGFSTGLVYVPAVYSDTEELVALCEVVAARDKPFFVHVRSESDRVGEATGEVIEVAERSGVHLHYSHIKAAGRRNWGKAQALIDALESAAASGMKLTADIHPYMAGSTSATVLLPPWMHAGGRDAMRSRLQSFAVRRRLREQILHDTESWDNWYDFSGGWSGLRVADCSRPDVAGVGFDQLIRHSGVDDLTSPEAFDVVWRFLDEEDFAVTLISFNNVEENVARFFARPYCSVGSDGVVNPDGVPHPRLYGTFGRVLGRLVRELGVVDLPTAIHKITSQAAEIVGLGDVAGRIAVGRPADLVLFDATTIADRATYENPRVSPSGIEGVWVGGHCVVMAGELTGPAPVAGD
jgi:N-acyl-D-amino-acid deacylase